MRGVGRSQLTVTRARTQDDKFALAESLGNLAVAGTLNCLQVLGLDAGGLRVLRDWAAERAVTLRFKAEERCVFDRVTKREVESTVAHVREYSGGLKITDKASGHGVAR